MARMARKGFLLGLMIFAVSLLTLYGTAGATSYDSGSTGVLGPYAPTASETLTTPSDGIFNYTTIDIPAGVTVTFTKNSLNASVYLLATSDVNIAVLDASVPTSAVDV